MQEYVDHACTSTPFIEVTTLPGEVMNAFRIFGLSRAKLNGLNPQAYLADVLARIADHPAHCRTPALELAARRHHPRCGLIWPAHRVLTSKDRWETKSCAW